ncbi:MAG: nuclease A inhibitor family protein [Rhizonema sp. NSF051]|nr:nuclease A inhibitor family protein [Rhizonema sp. NSF051]
MTNQEIIEQLKAASRDLVFISESDYPFDVFLWEGMTSVTSEKVLQQTAHPQDTLIEVVPLESFFRQATTVEDWQSPEEQETAKNYQALVSTLKSNLSNLQVYRLGTIEINVYILGQTSTGDSAGLSTLVVET